MPAKIEASAKSFNVPFAVFSLNPLWARIYLHTYVHRQINEARDRAHINCIEERDEIKQYNLSLIFFFTNYISPS